MSGQGPDISQLFGAISSGDKAAWKQLFSVVYDELHRLAHSTMRKERRGQTLQTTDLVHEAYLRLTGDRDDRFLNRAHFFSAAGSAMRRIMVDRARGRATQRRGSGRRPISFDERDAPLGASNPTDENWQDLEALNTVMDRLQQDDRQRRRCSIVELRFFVGLGLAEIAEALGISLATVKREWDFTRAWIRREMKRLESHGC